MKKKILKLLESWQIEDRISGVNYIYSVNFDIIAEELAILFAIPNVSQRSELLIDFLIHLNNKGLINNHDFDYEKEAKKYVKKIN